MLKTYLAKVSLRLVSLGLVACFGISGLAHAAAPRIFYSDLESGPDSGGEGNGGAFVTLYGSGFGASQGSSSISTGGGKATLYKSWSDSKLTFQLGSAAVSGNIIVTTAAGASNGVPFTVRPGSIFYISTSGNDSSSGAFSSPWRSIPFAVHTMHSGDIVYAMNGVTQTTEDGEGWNAALTLRNDWCSGSAGPRALVAYPGAKVTLGSTTSSVVSIRSVDASAGGGACVGNWVFAGLSLYSTDAMVLAGGKNWRIVNNEFWCPNGDGASGCFESSQANNIKFLGNNVHDTGKANASSLYHAVYFSTDSNHIEMAWNTVANAHGCRGVQVHSSPLGSGTAGDPTGHNQYDLSFHDNLIHDTQCDGIVLYTIDPSKGKVEVYNNVIYNAGKGPNNPQGSGAWSCINVQGHTNNGPVGSGTVEVHSNTLYGCGTFASPPYGGSSAGVMNGGENDKLFVRIRNNIFYQTNAAAPYVIAYNPASGSQCAYSDDCRGVYGSNNLFYGIGPEPANTNITASLSADPLFVNLASRDFHLSTGSPAADAGIALGLTADFDGALLPQGAGFPIGAFELVSKTTTGVNVSVSPANVSLLANGTQTFAATVTGASDTSVTWSLSPAVGSLTSSGHYTAPAVIASAQDVTVVATSRANSTKAASAVVSLQPVSVKLNGPFTITEGKSQQITATVTGTTNTSVSWSISPVLGSISASGSYTAPASVASPQSVTITAKSIVDGTKTGTTTVTVSPAAGISVSVAPAVTTLLEAQSKQFVASVSGSTNTAVTWSLSPHIGSITGGGLYTAPATVSSAQTVKLTATAAADRTKSATVSINLTLAAVSIQVSPLTATILPNATKQFTVTGSGLSNTSVRWTISPQLGTITATGLYTAPIGTLAPQTISIQATALADTTKVAVAQVTVPAVTAPTAYVVVPGTVSLNANQTQQFVINGATTAPAVTWSVTPAVGTITSAGLYQAPSTITATQIVKIVATGSGLTTSVTVTLQPTTPYKLAVTMMSATQAKISWTAPSGRPRGDWIGLSAVGAPSWWTLWQNDTLGATSGSYVVNLPLAAGLYEFRYYGNLTYTVVATAAPIPINTSGFSVTSNAAIVAPSTPLTLTWTAGGNRTANDFVALVNTAGTALWYVGTGQAASGTLTRTAPSSPGTYELRYWTQGGYVTVARKVLTVR